MKIAIITDIHFGVRGNKDSFLNNASRFFDEIFFPTLDKENISTVIDLGDTFDNRKSGNYSTLYRANEMFFKPMQDRHITYHSIIGNHTAYFKNTNSINTMEMLGLDKGMNFNIYVDDPVEVWFDGLKVLLVPWITPENAQSTLDKIKNSTSDIVMGHFELNGFEMQRGMVCQSGMSTKIFKPFDAVYSGHFHHPSDKGKIRYLGAPYEMNWSDHEGRRGFHILDTETRQLTFHANPFRMFHKLEYDDTDLDVEDIEKLELPHLTDSYIKVIVKVKTNPYLLDLFMDKLAKENPADIKILEDAVHEFDSDEDIIDEAQDTSDIIDKYVGSIGLEGTLEERVNAYVSNLYTRAIG